MTGRPPPDWLTEYTFAHRGLHGEIGGKSLPENSFAAIRAAMDAGLGIECDVQLSQDGKAMVFHDFELDRLTQNIGRVAGHSAAELRQMVLAGTDQTIWLLEELFEAVDARVPILVEVKSRADYTQADISKIATACNHAVSTYSGPVSVMSFDPRVPKWFASEAPEVTRGLVATDTLPNGFERVWRDSESVAGCDPEFLAIDLRDAHCDAAANWRQSGSPLLTWTVRTADDRAKASLYADAQIAEGQGIL